MKNLIILNTTPFAQRIGDIAKQSHKYAQISYLGNKTDALDVIDTLANFVLYLDDDTDFYPAFENNTTRTEWLNSIMSVGGNLATIIQPTAQISPTARILPGCAIFDNVTIKDNAVVKSGSVIDSSVTLEENCVIDSYSYIVEKVVGK